VFTCAYSAKKNPLYSEHTYVLGKLKITMSIVQRSKILVSI
jgi:hypothetical protein